MELLENLKNQANKVYKEAMNCSDLYLKRKLFDRYEDIHQKYKKQRAWIMALES